MPDSIQEVVERLNRAADRYRNAGDMAGAARAEQAAQQAGVAPDLAAAESIENTFTETSATAGDPVPSAPERTAPGTAGTVGGDRYVVYEDSVMAGGSASWRNNNPGNIVAGSFADSHGAIGEDANGFAIFPDEDTGRTAQIALLNTDKYQSDTITEAVQTWAPPKDNPNWQNYVNSITSALGVEADTDMSDLTAAQIEQFADAQQRFEGWIEGNTYTGGDSDPTWALDALGLTEPNDNS